MKHVSMGLLVLMLALLSFPLAWGQTSGEEVPDRRRESVPSGLFAPGVMVDKTVYIAGKGDYKPDEEIRRQGRATA